MAGDDLTTTRGRLELARATRDARTRVGDREPTATPVPRGWRELEFGWLGWFALYFGGSWTGLAPEFSATVDHVESVALKLTALNLALHLLLALPAAAAVRSRSRALRGIGYALGGVLTALIATHVVVTVRTVLLG